MAIIQLSFTSKMALAIRDGRKLCTTRLEQKGNPGDEFLACCCGEPQRIIDVIQLPLWRIATEMYRLEGFNSPEEFIKTWNTLPGYPEYKYAKYAEFPVHFFLPAREKHAID